MQHECMLNWDEVDLLDDGEESFEELNKDLVTVLQLKAYIIRLHPRQILQNHQPFHKNIRDMFADEHMTLNEMIK